MRQVIILLLAGTISLAAFSQKRIALLIGNRDYSNEDLLHNPINDVELVGAALAKCGFDTIVLHNLNKNDFIKAINQFASRVSNNIYTNGAMLFYYAGHGAQMKERSYIIPIGGGLKVQPNVEDGWIDEDVVFNTFGGLGVKFNFIVLDACRKVLPFSSGTRSAGGNAMTLSWTPANSFVMYSASPGQSAKDGEGKQSEFAKSFASHLLDKNATIESIFRAVKSDVYFKSHEQTPWATTTLGSVFVFTKSADAGTTMDGRIKISCNAPCIVSVNGGEKHALQDNKQTFEWVINSGYNTVSAVSRDYPDVQYSESFNAAQEDLTGTMREVIPMSELVRQRKLAPVLDSLMYNNWELIQAGSYRMGLNSGKTNESPEHEVRLNPYYIKRYEVSQEEWTAVMGNNPSQSSQCNECPVDNISWEDAQQFINKLQELGVDGVRLLTEAEWEYAARGGGLGVGTSDKFSGTGRLERAGWFFGNSGGQSHARGALAANDLGLFDMSGNVAEWCNDVYEGYKSGKQENPSGPRTGSSRVVRGGSWNDYDQLCRVYSREGHPAEYRSKAIGIRLAKSTK